MISNSGKDENGKYSSGKAGDQTGKEWHIIEWYNRPWNCVLRHPKEEVRQLIADMARAAAKNNHIGYDQGQRTTFWDELKKAKYKVNDIKKDCEADCSAGVCSIVKAVGYRKNITKLKNIPITTTHYMRKEFKAAGFEVLTDSKYLTSDDYLLPGDILLNDQHHTATNLDKGKKVKDEKPKNNKKYAKVTTKGSELNCRAKPSVLGSVVGTFKNGAKLEVISKSNSKWYKVKGNSTNKGKLICGYCRSSYLKEI